MLMLLSPLEEEDRTEATGTKPLAINGATSGYDVQNKITFTFSSHFIINYPTVAVCCQSSFHVVVFCLFISFLMCDIFAYVVKQAVVNRIYT